MQVFLKCIESYISYFSFIHILAYILNLSFSFISVLYALLQKVLNLLSYIRIANSSNLLACLQLMLWDTLLWTFAVLKSEKPRVTQDSLASLIQAARFTQLRLRET